jgi:hypothetical protein
MHTASSPLGPVDVVLLAFPDGRVEGGISGVVADIVGSGAARLLDAVLVEKRVDGETVITDIDHYGDSLDVVGIPGQLPGLLSDTDVQNVSAEMVAGSAALLIAWENSWAVRLRQEAQQSGAEVVLHERIGDPEVSEAVQFLATFAGAGGDPSMNGRAQRADRAG